MRGRVVIPFACVIALALPQPAGADTFRVTKRGDPAPGACTGGDCSLREAVLAANANPGADVVLLPKRGLHQLSLPGDDDGAMAGDLDVTNDPLRIAHPRKGRAVIDFNPPDDGFPDPFDRVFENFAGAPLTLRKLTVTEGGDPTGSPNGGGIYAGEDVTLVKTRLVRNEIPGWGGGIYTTGGVQLRLRDSAVRGNTAGSYGGGIFHLTTTSFDPGALRVTGSVIAGNSATLDGGGFYFSADSPSVIKNSTIAGNTAGSEGAGFYGDGGVLSIRGSTISENRAGSHGGGVSIDGTDSFSIVNSTIASNRADGVGGGINAESDIRLNAVTVARNRANADGLSPQTGGGLFLEAGDVFTVENSLVALNTVIGAGGAVNRNDCAGDPFNSLGHNLLSTASMCSGFDAAGDIVRRRARIGRLQRNGGPTKTIALKKRSPAIGSAKRASAPNRDQRGVKRDRRPDIGAYERKRRRR